MSELDNLEFTRAAEKLLGICRIYYAKRGNNSPTKKELLKMANEVLESRA